MLFSWIIPGSPFPADYEVDEAGQLQALTIAGRQLIRRSGPWLVFGQDWVRYRHLAKSDGWSREMYCNGQRSHEDYRLDSYRRWVEIDGMTYGWDEEGRISRTQGQGQGWSYGYRGKDLAWITGPHGKRSFDEDRTDEKEITENDSGVTFPGGIASKYQPHRDGYGRTWTVSDQEGHIRATYLWWGWACLARIDGPPDAPLAAVFCLDPSLTPVRTITANGMRRIPRDAFGENLLAHHDTPGLFGGWIGDDLVHYRYRRLDPRRGRYLESDPYDGSLSDPRRRAAGFKSLPSEIDIAGPRAVCRNDPIDRVDFEAAISAGWETALVTLSSLTWSFQHNVVGYSFFGFYNLLGGLLSFDGDAYEELVHFDGIYSDYVGAYALHIGNAGMRKLGFPDRLFSYQHTHWSKPDVYVKKQHARVFVPAAEFRPDYYGAMLLLKPLPQENEEETDHLLLSNTNLQDFNHGANSSRWRFLLPSASDVGEFTRSGGEAAAVIPGGRTPFFPHGGFHFASRDFILAPTKGTIQAIYPKAIAPSENGIRLRIFIEDFADNLPAKGSSLILELDWVNDEEDTVTESIGIMVEARKQVGGSLYIFSQQLGSNTISKYEFPQSSCLYQTSRANLVGSFQKSGQDHQLDARGGNPPSLKVDTNLLVTPTASPDQAFVSNVKLIKAEIEMHAERIQPGATMVWQTKIIRGDDEKAPKAQVINGTKLAFEEGTAPSVGEAILVFKDGDEEPHLITKIENDGWLLERPLKASLAALAEVQCWPIKATGKIGRWRSLRSNGTTWTMEFDRSGVVQPDDILLLGEEAESWVDMVQVVSVTSEIVDLNQFGLVHGASYDVSLLEKDALFATDAESEEFYCATLTTQDMERFKDQEGFVFHRQSGNPLLSMVDSTIARAQENALPKLSRVHTQPMAGGLFALPELATAAKPQIPARPAIPSIPPPLLVNVPFADHTILINDPTNNVAIQTGFDECYGPAVGSPIQVWDTGQPAKTHTSLVQSIEASLTFSGGLQLNQPADGDIELVGLEPQGFVYQVENHPSSISKIRVLPHAYQLNNQGSPDRSSGGLVLDEVAMPRFYTGDFVRLIDTSLAVIHKDLVLRIKEVHGGQLVFDEFIPQSRFPNIAIQRMVPEDPKTGGNRLAIKGRPDHAGIFIFSVWAPNMVRPGKTLAVIHGQDVWTKEVFSIEHLAIKILPVQEWLANPPGHIDLTIFNIENLNNLLGKTEIFEHLLATPKGNGRYPYSVKQGFLVGYGSNENHREVKGHFSSGTGQVPVDESRSVELDLRQALEAHELRHTQQTAMFGPILTACIPLHAIEATARLAFDEDPNLPEYSPYQRATLERNGNQRLLTIANSGEINFATDKRVQIAQDLLQRSVILGSQVGTSFAVDLAEGFADGEVFVRLQKSDDAAGLAAFNSWAEILTLGGLQMMTTGSAMRWFAFGVSALIRVFREEPFHWTILNPDRYPAIQGPQASSIQVLPNSEGSHDFRVHDSLEIRQRDQTQHLVVTAVNGDIVELDGLPNEGIVADSFQVERIGEQHPMHQVIDYTLLDDFRWFFDPIGKMTRRISAAEDIQSGSSLEWFLTSLRWTMSTMSWSGLPISLYFFDNFIPQVNKTAYTSFLEQNASEHSGNLYSTLGRWHNQPSHVGDLGIYQVFFHQRSFVEPGRGESPGIHITDQIRITPAPEESGTLPPDYDLAEPDPNLTHFEPNLKWHAGENSANQVPDLLFDKHPHLPLACAAKSPFGYKPSDHGKVPMSPTLDRSNECYVAFNGGFGGGSYRLTTPNGVTSDIYKSRLSQEEDAQELIFEGQVQPVEIKVNGQQIQTSLTVVLGQEVTFDVEPSQNRIHEVTLPDPIDSEFLRAGKKALQIQAHFSLGEEMLEIARVHESGKPFDFHLLDRLFIPVRQIKVELINQLSFRSAASHLAAEKNQIKPGESVFLLVPASLNQVFLPKLQTAPAGPSPEAEIEPLATNTLDAEIRAYLGKGQAYRISFSQDTVVNAAIDYTWQLPLAIPKNMQGPIHLIANLKLIP